MSAGEEIRHWLATRARNLAWVRLPARWQARLSFTPYALRFRIARWANLLALDSGAPAEVETTQHNLRLILDLRDHLQWVTYYFGAHEPHLMPVILNLLRPGTGMIDLGAHIGIYTLLAGRFYQNGSPDPYVLAVEPNPQIFERLQRHIALNNLSDVVRAVRAAVGDHEGEVDLYLSQFPNSANSALRDLRGSHPHTQDGVTARVRLARLDTLVEETRLVRPIGLIKADIEGAELEAFRGAADVLTVDRPFVLFEAHPVWMQRFGYALKDMLDFWAAQRYHCFVVGREGFLQLLLAGNLHDAAMDCLAVPEEQSASLSQTGLRVRHTS